MASKFAAARGSRLPHTVQRYSRLGRRGASAGSGGGVAAVAAVVAATATSAVHSSALGLTVTSMLTTEASTRV